MSTKPNKPNLEVELYKCVMNNDFVDAMFSSMSYSMLHYMFATHSELNKEELYSWCKPDQANSDIMGAFALACRRISTSLSPGDIIDDCEELVDNIFLSVEEGIRYLGT